MRRNLRSLRRHTNPARELVPERQRAFQMARSRDRSSRLEQDLPSIVNEQVGEHMQKLETKLVESFRTLGLRVVEEGANALNEQLEERIETLERVSKIQTRTITGLRDSSMAANVRVGEAVEGIERTLAGAVPGFRLDPPAVQAVPMHDQFRLEARTVYNPPAYLETDQSHGRLGFCPSCTSTNVRRARRTGIFDQLVRLLFMTPFRCRSCRHKFYKL